MKWFSELFIQPYTVEFAVGCIEEYDTIVKEIPMEVLSSQLKPCVDIRQTYNELRVKIKDRHYSKFVLYCMKNKIQFRKVK